GVEEDVGDHLRLADPVASARPSRAILSASGAGRGQANDRRDHDGTRADHLEAPDVPRCRSVSCSHAESSVGQHPANQAFRKAKMSGTPSAPELSKSVRISPANQALRNAKMSCTLRPPEPSKSARHELHPNLKAGPLLVSNSVVEQSSWLNG